MINKVLKVFNNYNESLKFTLKIKSNRSIPFLNIKIINKNNSLHTDWYIKLISSTRFLNDFSNHPTQLKRNIICRNIWRDGNLICKTSNGLSNFGAILENNCFEAFDYTCDRRITRSFSKNLKSRLPHYPFFLACSFSTNLATNSLKTSNRIIVSSRAMVFVTHY